MWRSSSDGKRRSSSAPVPEGSMHARSRSWTSGASPIGSLPRGRPCRQRPSATRRSTSATSPPGIPTRWVCSRTTSSESCSAGSRHGQCRSIVGWRSRASPRTIRASRFTWPQGSRWLPSTWSGPTAGGRAIGKRAGTGFAGCGATRSNLIAEVEVSEETPPGARIDAIGIHGLTPMEDGRTMRVLVTEQEIGPATEPTLADLSNALTLVYGTDFGIHNPTWLSRFTDATRQAAAYRDGRVLLAGDAAHIHYPSGGLGIGPGVQDAVNLGWKLAEVVKGIADDSLLDTYHVERPPATARALKYTMAQSLFQRADARQEAMRDMIREMLAYDEPRKLIVGLISGLDLAYDLGEGPPHPLLGRRMPDLDLTTPDGPRHVYELLHEARPVLLDLGEPGSIDIAAWSDRVQHIEAGYTGVWELPVLGAVAAPTAVLIRPDGHVAWVGGSTQEGLTNALTTWFGQPCTNAEPWGGGR